MSGHGSPHNATDLATDAPQRAQPTELPPASASEVLRPRTPSRTPCGLRALRPISLSCCLLSLLLTFFSPGSGRTVRTTAQEAEGRGRSFLDRFGGALRVPLVARPVESPVEETEARTVPPSSKLSLRIRATWGGGEAQAWQGELRVANGSLSDVVNLGREADDPGSFDCSEDSVQIVQPSQGAYGGCDITIRGEPNATVTLDLAPRDRPTESRRFTARLDSLVSQPFLGALDERGNRVHLARAPGDSLRVLFERDSLVLSPGEDFVFSVAPYATGIDPAMAVRLRVWVAPARTQDELSRQEFDPQPSAESPVGEFGPITLKLPEKEGVYDLHLELIPRRSPASLPLGRAKPLLRRAVQLAVVSPRASPIESVPWRSVGEFDPSTASFGESAGTSRWSDWLKRIPTLKTGTGFSQGPIGNQLASRHEHGGRNLVQLAAGGWMAYPLPVNRLDEPHVLEVEYPRNIPQTLGVSLVEPNAAGRIAPLGLDSGIEVGEALPGSEPGWLRHRMVFWPRTKTPLVVLVNRDAHSPALFGKLAVLAGPSRLPPSPIVTGPVATSSVAVTSIAPNASVAVGASASGINQGSAPADRRLAAAFLDRPVFPENFGAAEAYDAEADGVWDDWLTFYQGATRLVEYLKYSGYNSAVVSVACEGSAIYPSRLLEPTPKYDSGVFFSGGHDPIRKDVLELLFRLFDREGLKLIPAVQFSSPLPELEQIKRRGGAESAGLEWIGADGQPWCSRHPANRGLAPYYNLLDPRVRQATLNVVEELEQRYAHHPSWAGLSLQLGPDTYATLPGAHWGYDDQTMARFAEDTGASVSGSGAKRFAERAKVLQGEQRSRWLAWRAAVVAEWYGQVRQRIARRQTDSLLLLAGADLVTSPVVQQFARPALPVRQPAAEALLHVGIDPKLLASQSGVVLLRPYRSSPVISLADQGVNLEWNRSAEIDRLFAQGPLSGGLNYHEAMPLALPAFDQASPFGPDKTQLWMASHFVRSDARNRQRLTRCLATADARIFVDGGWMLPIGGEDSLRPALTAFRQLPDVKFESLTPSVEPNRHVITVRQAVVGEETAIYLLNDAPWPVTTEVQFSGPGDLNSLIVGSFTGPAANLARADDGWRWRVALGAYDLRVLRFRSPDVVVRDWQTAVAPDVPQQLSLRVAETRARANQLRSPQAVESLRNPGFETQAGESPGQWLHARGPGIQVVTDPREHRGGERSLRLRSEKEVVWVRSEPVPTPSTGRIAVWAWIKVRDPSQQATLRLAIEGKLDGKTYYRYASVGNDSKGSTLQSDWTQYWFQIDDLPSQGLTDLRVGFDMMGAGEAWIDDVQLFDLWFYDNERDELIKHIGLADFNLSNGRLRDCERFLDGYWPRFLQRHVPLDQRLVQLPVRRTSNESAVLDRIGPTRAESARTGDAKSGDARSSVEKTTPKPSEKTGWRDRLDSLIPRKFW